RGPEHNAEPAGAAVIPKDAVLDQRNGMVVGRAQQACGVDAANETFQAVAPIAHHFRPGPRPTLGRRPAAANPGPTSAAVEGSGGAGWEQHELAVSVAAQ